MKWEKCYVIIALCVLPILATAQSFFKDGMTWKTEISGTESPSPSSIIVNYINGSETIDGYKALKMYEYEEGKPQEYILIGYIRTDGDKVYFHGVDEEFGGWYLMYDFGLDINEGCYVYSTYPNSSNKKPEKTYMKCVGKKMTTSIDARNEFTTLLVEEYVDNTLKHFHGNGEWIKGLSCDMGVMYNNRFGLVGIGRELIEASYNGTTIYKKSYTAISENNKDATNVTLSGRIVTLHNFNHNEIIKIYTSMGNCIGTYTVKTDNTNITLPNKGIYILKSRSTTHKIIIR